MDRGKALEVLAKFQAMEKGKGDAEVKDISLGDLEAAYRRLPPGDRETAAGLAMKARIDELKEKAQRRHDWTFEMAKTVFNGMVSGALAWIRGCFFGG